MGWKDVLKKEIRLPIPGIPEGAVPSVTRRAPFLSWYAQQYDRDRRSVLSQLLAIVSTNSPLPEGLRACAEDAPNSVVRRQFRDLARRIESGHSLGQAMMVSGGFFKMPWIGLVLASERTGTLARALNAILDDHNVDIEAAELSRNRITYFGGLVIFQIFIMTFIVMRVMPVFAEILTEFSYDVPESARYFIWLRDAVALNYQIVLGVAAGLLIMVILGPFLFRLSGFIQFLTSHAVLPMPIFGPYYRARVLESLASTLHLLCRGGMPLPDALGFVARGGHVPQPFARAIGKVAKSVERGDTLSQALARHPYLFGRRFIEIVKFGEGRQDLASAFAQAHDLYRRRVLRRRRALTDALVPLGVAICGSGVLLASLSLYTMLVSIGDSIMNAM